ncbi:MAG: hypothetical protein H7332_13760 [Bdellovibrionales bacterium]|nr:hypothetical protein [Ramlibacter sp.]
MGHPAKAKVIARSATDIGILLSDVALPADFDAKDQQKVEGSFTFVLNEGQQKLNGNVGYRIVEASIHELLADPGDRATWYQAVAKGP